MARVRRHKLVLYYLKHRAMNVYFVTINAIAVIWGRWLLADVAVRADYNHGVKNACGNILEAMRAGTVPAMDAARDAHAIRNKFLISMRSRTSPIGLSVAERLKPAGGTYEFYPDKYAQSRYGKPIVDLTNNEALIVGIYPLELDYGPVILTS